MTPEYPDGELPPNVRVGPGTRIGGGRSFKEFKATGPDAAVIGQRCTLNGVSFAVGRDGRLTIGDCCFFSGAILLAEEAVTIGSHVLLGWGVTVADSDFHPVDPALRAVDAEACSNVGHGRQRPAIVPRPVVIEDDVYVGPMATILKGVTIGRGSFIEPGAVVTRSVPALSRVAGNPARVVGTVDEESPDRDTGLRPVRATSAGDEVPTVARDPHGPAARVTATGVEEAR